MKDSLKLKSFLERGIQDKRLIVVSNREPYVHKKHGAEIRVEQPVGGLTSALDSVLRVIGGVWVAWGSGSADKRVVDRNDHIGVPPDKPTYTLKRVWLSTAEVENYYHGYSNHVLWPLCHIALERIYFRKKYWDDYVAANQKFAQAVSQEVLGDSIVWIHDYHLSLLPRALRDTHPGLTLAHFWHVPWPNYSVLRVSPQARQLLEGMLANDLIGFQITHFAANFMECVEHLIPEAQVDHEASTVTYKGHKTSLEAFPVSVDYDRFNSMASSRRSEKFTHKFRAKLGITDQTLLVVGVDRLEYTKGLTKRIQAIELFFERYSRYRKRVTFYQVAVPTRSSEPYLSYMKGVQEVVKHVNRRCGTDSWLPIIYTETKVEQRDLAVIYRAADLCIVSSIYDGMNLVAKEFISCQVDEKGVLLLSELAGAAEELEDAIIVNPYDLDSFSSSIKTALSLRPNDKKKRMQRLREKVSEFNIHVWIGCLLQRMSDIASAKAGGTAYLFDHLEQIHSRELFLFLDFDGTMAPIASTPDKAVMPEHLKKILNKLKKMMPIAIISGRALDDVRAKVGISDLIYSGNHGMEIWDGTRMVRNEAGDVSMLGELLAKLQTSLGKIPGILVENKVFSASVHFRKVPPKRLADVFRIFWDVTKNYDSFFNITEGKKVLEIRSKAAWNKGHAVNWILEKMGNEHYAVYIGDDVTDEDAFRAITSKGASICVGKDLKADYFLENQDEVGKFLEWLLIRGMFRALTP